MAIPLWVSRAEIFDEFSPDEQKEHFNLTRDKFLAAIDNFYYVVFLDEKEGKQCIDDFIYDLEKMKEAFDFKSGDKIDYYGFDFYPFGMKGYNYRLSLPECFDILVRSSLPNDKTPRIWVQIRARYLWLDNPRKCFKRSFDDLKRILGDYGIKVLSVQENRVDYCHHNNAIQNPEKFFDRPKLQKHCKTTARIYNLVGNPQNNWSLDYCSIGSRKSKSLFFRIYNKTREVVELNYKSFFIQIWYENGLISSYDKFCLEYAFNLKSYDVGLLCGQLMWYIHYGKNESLKDKFRDLYKKYFADNSNSKKIRNGINKTLVQQISYDDIFYVRKIISNVLPPVTVITNIEFETHRDFYKSFDESLLKVKNKALKRGKMLARINAIYGYRKSFVDYLTSYGNFVAFVKDNSVELKDFENDMYLKFWKRMRQAKWNTKYNPDLYRIYERNIDIERMKRKIVSDAAVLSIYKNGENMQDLTEDFYDVLGTLNDNDMHGVTFYDPVTGECPDIRYGDHYTVKMRKNRQYRTVVSSPGQVDDK